MQTYIAKTLQGLEPVLAAELSELGATKVQSSSRAVLFDATQEVLYQANYRCRTALRILKRIKTFHIEKQDDLYEQVYEVTWEKIFPVDALMTISATCIDSIFTHSRFVSQRVKDAIADRFRRVLGQRPSVDNEFYTIRVELFMRQNQCDLLLDASGLSLHNRGYRKPNSEMFNEVMAAGILQLSGWDARRNLFLPFTEIPVLAIEAAMMACRMPAGYYRKGYSFQFWNDYDPQLWKTVREEGISRMCDPEADLYAATSDGLAYENMEALLKKLRLHHDVEMLLFDFTKGLRPQEPDLKDCTLILKLPFFDSPENFEAENFCTMIGDILKRQYAGSEAWVYGNDMDAIKFIGLKPFAKFNLREVGREAKFHGFRIS